MAKPIIKHIQPFDADKDYEISILWTGGRVYSNRIYIYDNETNTPVFDHAISSYVLKHTIPAHTLENGKKYVIQVQTFDADHAASALSNKVLFYTFKTPEFYFENLPEHSVISNSSYAASIHYHSDDSEPVGKYVFYLYDALKRQLLVSSEMTDSHNIGYIYKGLDNNTVYYFRCIGVTANGMELGTGYVEVTVKFENPNTYARIYATPLPSQGCIQVATNLIIIEYTGEESFEYPDGMINLREKTLYYNQGFLIKDDFTVLIRGVNLWQNADIFTMSCGKADLTLSSHIYTNDTLRFRLFVPNGLSNYIIYSKGLVFGNDDPVSTFIRRKNNIYQLEAFVGGE